MRRQLPDRWAARTGGRVHLLEGGRGAMCGARTGFVQVGFLADGPEFETWCLACLRSAESAAESVRAELAHLERIGVL